MRQIVVLLLFTFLFIFSFSQKSDVIYVSSWINKPKVEEFNKPLIYIDFWATWCGPCIKSMPHTESIANEFEDDLLVFFMSNEPSGKIAKFMKKRDLHFFSAVDSTGMNIENYNVTAIPRSILLNTKGRLIWEGNPNEMTVARMRHFVNHYKTQRGKKDRVKLLKRSLTLSEWEISEYLQREVKFIEAEDIAQDFYVLNEDYLISGSISYFVSFINNIPISQVESKLEIDENYMVSFKAKDIDDFKKTLRDFIKDECEVHISKNKIKKNVYFVEAESTENYFDKNMYNFEKGDNFSLVDDMSVMIDNATPEEAISKLSGLSEKTFIFKGKNQNKYDWILHYKFFKTTKEQLKDLGFVISEKEKKLDFYILTD